MNRFEEQLKKGASFVRLMPDEKATMREDLEAFMVENPLEVPPRYWMHGWMPRVAAPLIAVLVFGSTAYAAQGALPGDVLYPVKVNVNEAVVGALATTDSAKASWNASVASERVVEAQQLAAQGRLTASTTQELQSNFDTHAAAAASYTNKVAATDPEGSAQLQSQLSEVGAQGAVLAAIGNESDSKEVKASSENFAASIQAAAAATSTTVQVATAAVMAPSTSSPATASSTTSAAPQDSAAAAQVKADALQELSGVENDYASLFASTTASTTAALNDHVAMVQALIAQGDAASSTSDAVALYTRALTKSTVLNTFLQASNEFNAGILSSLLEAQSTSTTASSTVKTIETAKQHIYKHH